MKAVIYARYSSDNQREESIEGQLRECTAYCKKNDITILRTYIDRAMSAKTDHRPDFQRMIKDSAKGLFDVIIVWKLDRFARNRYDSAHYKALLRKYGVKVLSATENISEGPEGIILESMLEGMAEYYSAELSEKVIRGHTENALKCKYNGGTPTFGFIIDKEKCYQIDPHTAPVVLESFTRYADGATMKEVMQYLVESGFTTVRGRKIDLNFIARLLKNRKYIGEYSYRHIVTPGGIPAIVPQDLFDRVQQRLEANRKAPARHKAEDDYLLTTKLFCGTCGAMMVGESGTSASKGRKYHYYRCVNTKKHKTCNAKHKSVRKIPLENAVVSAVMAKVMNDDFVEYIADRVLEIQGMESSELPALRQQLAETERGIENMLNAIQMGIINQSTKQRLDELEERKKEIELRIIQEEIKKPMLSREDVTFWICRFRKLDVSRLEERRRLIDSFVNSVTIFDDYLLITFNYKDGETRLDFKDIESSDLQSVGGPESEYIILMGDVFGFLIPFGSASMLSGQLSTQMICMCDNQSEERLFVGKKSTKENKTKYHLAREELEWSREYASEQLGMITPERLERIENEKVTPDPKEILAMAETYGRPSLCNYYCSQKCPIGQQYVPEIEVKELSSIVLEMLASLNSVNKRKDRLIEITADGKIDNDEIDDFIFIQEELERISITVETLQLWSEKMLANGVINADAYRAKKNK